MKRRDFRVGTSRTYRVVRLASVTRRGVSGVLAPSFGNAKANYLADTQRVLHSDRRDWVFRHAPCLTVDVALRLFRGRKP
jgi:hypothetical protein